MGIYSGVDTDEDDVESRDGHRYSGLRNQSVIQTGLSCGAVVVGVIAVVLMVNNESFPAFTLTPVAVGLLGLTTGSLGIVVSRKTPDSHKNESRNKNIIFIHYLLNVLTATLSCVGTVYSCISGALCAGMELKTSRGADDVMQFCKPNTELSLVFAFVNGGMCVLVGIWSMRGVCSFCYYGSFCGLNNNTVE